VDLGLDVDLGLGDANNGVDNDPGVTDSSNPDTTAPVTPTDLGGLLDGLLRRPGRR
jgi:hypothetical protein